MIRLRSPQDFFAGLMFIAFGSVGAWVAQKYPFGTSIRMGPGYLPVVLSWCMVVMGVIITARGVVLDGDKIAPIKLRPLLFVLGAVLVYAYSIERLGLAISVFLGGWRGPFLPPFAWFMIKLSAFLFFYIWLRATFPRLRYDQLMGFGWKVLLPASLLNLAITAVVVALKG